MNEWIKTLTKSRKKLWNISARKCMKSSCFTTFNGYIWVNFMFVYILFQMPRLSCCECDTVLTVKMCVRNNKVYEWVTIFLIVSPLQLKSTEMNVKKMKEKNEIVLYAIYFWFLMAHYDFHFYCDFSARMTMSVNVLRFVLFLSFNLCLCVCMCVGVCELQLMHLERIRVKHVFLTKSKYFYVWFSVSTRGRCWCCTSMFHIFMVSIYTKTNKKQK